MFYNISKRVFDLLASIIGLVVVFPICFLISCLIVCDSSGSPLFTQIRVGRNRKRFLLFKLRSMKVGVGDYASHEVGQNQITRVGKLIRRLKLDEFPQLINVLNGTMSLVGPRPCLPSQSQVIFERQQKGLFDFRPGITGPAQIRGIDMSQPELLAEIESNYFPNATLFSDAYILLCTIAGRGQGDVIQKDDGSLL